MTVLVSRGTAPVLQMATRTAVAGQSFDPQGASEMAKALLADDADDVDVAALLTALAIRGPQAVEVAALVRTIVAAAVAIPWDGEATADIVGTGGDGSGSINISTLAALVAAAAGATVAKAGNRAATSRCGSADLLEALKLPLQPGPDGLAMMLRTCRFTFVFTPALHPTVGRRTAVRRRLGFRTLFNLAGPLSNPVAAGARLIGTADPQDQEVLAEAAWLLGYQRTWVVRGDDGLDELSTTVPTQVWAVNCDGIESRRISPLELGVLPAGPDDLAGGDVMHNAAVAEALFDGKASQALIDAVAANAGVVLHLSGLADDLGIAVRVARTAIGDGRVRQLVDTARQALRGTDDAY